MSNDEGYIMRKNDPARFHLKRILCFFLEHKWGGTNTIVHNHKKLQIVHIRHCYRCGIAKTKTIEEGQLWP